VKLTDTMLATMITTLGLQRFQLPFSNCNLCKPSVVAIIVVIDP